MPETTNDEKKRYLRQYVEAQRREKRLLLQIAELRNMKMFPSAKMDGMPKGSGHNDLSGYMAVLDGYLTDLEREREKAIQMHQTIHEAVKAMPNAIEQEILERRYLLVQGWERIAVEMNYDYRWTLRLHGRALANFQIPETDHIKP